MGIGNGAASLTISSPPIRAAALRCTVNERGAEIYPDAVEWECIMASKLTLRSMGAIAVLKLISGPAFASAPGTGHTVVR